MTAEEHYVRARWWGDRFDGLLGWAGPIRQAKDFLVGITLGGYAMDGMAGDVGLAMLVFWTVVQLVHKGMMKVCLRRLEMHGERYIQMMECK